MNKSCWKVFAIQHTGIGKSHLKQIFFAFSVCGMHVHVVLCRSQVAFQVNISAGYSFLEGWSPFTIRRIFLFILESRNMLRAVSSKAIKQMRQARLVLWVATVPLCLVVVQCFRKVMKTCVFAVAYHTETPSASCNRQTIHIIPA